MRVAVVLVGLGFLAFGLSGLRRAPAVAAGIVRAWQRAFGLQLLENGAAPSGILWFVRISYGAMSLVSLLVVLIGLFGSFDDARG